MAASLTIPKLDLWKNYRTFVDIGGSVGHLVSAVCRSQNHMKGIVADLPECRDAFTENIKREKMRDKVLFTPMDFFQHDFPYVDVVMIGHVLHNYKLQTQHMLV